MKLQFALSLALLSSSASALPATSPADLPRRSHPLTKRLAACTPAATDNLLFSVTMSTFQSARAAQNPSGCIWTSDNCSSSPDNPFGFNFTPSCQRHDFGYRNSKAQGRFTAQQKLAIDDNFKKDLRDACVPEGAVAEASCKALAEVYYRAVRTFGKRDLEIELDEPIPGQVVPEVREEADRVELEDLELLDQAL